MRRWLRDARRWALETEASTRSLGLLRIASALILWARFGELLGTYQEQSPTWIFVSVNFFVWSTLMCIGLWSRLATTLSALLCALLVYYYGLALDIDGFSSHHTRLMSYAGFLLALAPVGRSLSIDRWLAVRRHRLRGDPLPPERANLWALRLIALQVSAVYLWSAIDKTQMRWLNGSMMCDILMQFHVPEHPGGAWFDRFCVASTWLTVGFECTLGVGLLFRRTRRWLLLPGMLLHGLFYVLLPVATFTVTMWTLYLAYVDPDRVHAVIDDLVAPGGASGSDPAT